MLIKNWTVVFIFLTVAAEGFGQQRLTGKVIRKGSSEILIGATVVNLTKKRYTFSDSAGAYAIPASLGDSIVFTSAGYLPDTALVASYMLTENYLVALRPNIAILQSVDVLEMGKYRADSIQRHEEYSWLLDAKHPVKLMNEKRAGDAPGLSFSPLGFFSKREKQKRRLKRRLKEEEEYYYVNYKFSSARVSLLTGLKGDSLQMFIGRYRPSYSFCRMATDRDIFLYINDKLVLFKQGKL